MLEKPKTSEKENDASPVTRISKNKELNIKLKLNAQTSNYNANSESLTNNKMKQSNFQERNAIIKEISQNSINEEENEEDSREKEEISDEENQAASGNENEEDNLNIFDMINKDAEMDQFKIDEKNFDEIMNKNISVNKLKDYFEPCLYNTNDKPRFQPEINENSKNILNNKKLNQTSNQNKSTDNISKTRVEDELYVDAINRRKKKELLEENNIMGILLNANKTKISNNSHRIALLKLEKYIDDVVNKVDKEGMKRISFNQLGIILTELKIFREIINKDLKKNTLKEYASYKEIKMELKNLRDNEKRKKQEIEFYEQIWVKLNPENKEFIKLEIVQEFLKVLFSPSSTTIKEISSVITQFIQAAFFLVNSSSNEEKLYISPITHKSIGKEKIWDTEKFTKEFMNLKINILAYITTNTPSKALVDEIERDKKINSFHPKINSKKKEKKDIETNGKFYEARLKEILDREKIKYEVYSEAKKDLEENKLKECTFKPQINKKKENPNDNSNSKPIHEKLFKIHQEKLEKLERIQNDSKKLKEFDESKKYNFKPKMTSDIKNFEKSLNVEKPKGFDETVERIRNGIVEKYRKKYLLEKIPTGDNYEKIKNANIQPFNITDITKIDDETESSLSKQREDEDFFSMDINVAKGKNRQLKVYRSDNPQEIAENFCKVYGLKKEIADRLSKTIQDYMNLYLMSNENTDKHESKGNKDDENMEN